MFISCDFALLMAINLSCATLNVRGLNNERKRRQVFRWLHGRKFHYPPGGLRFARYTMYSCPISPIARR